MEFKFKRKYTGFFMLALILHLLVLSFWVLAPNNIFNTTNAKEIITLLSLVNTELILVFYLGLFRKKYYAFYNRLVIKRSFFKTINIEYSSIADIKEKQNDTIFLSFGSRPSFRISYTTKKGKRKKITVRSDNNELLLKVIKNELTISKK